MGCRSFECEEKTNRKHHLVILLLNQNLHDITQKTILSPPTNWPINFIWLILRKNGKKLKTYSFYIQTTPTYFFTYVHMYHVYFVAEDLR